MKIFYLSHIVFYLKLNKTTGYFIAIATLTNWPPLPFLVYEKKPPKGTTSFENKSLGTDV